MPYCHLPRLARLRETAQICAALALGPILAAGCSPVPDLDSASALRSPETLAASLSLQSSATAEWPGEGWWRGWGDAQLEGLIGDAYRDSPDVAAAAARLRRADAMAREAGAALRPAVDARGSASIDKQSLNNGLPEQLISLFPSGWEDNARIAVGAGFDLDLWGRNRAALAAATSEAQAAAVDAAQARLLLAAAIASAYADLARLTDLRDIRAAGLEVRLATARLVGARERNGLETRGSMRQAEAQVASARAELGAAEELAALKRHQLAALAGAGPDRGLAIARPTFAAALPAGLPDDVTTGLIGRRPDIAAARLRTEAAAQRIEVARAAFYPAVRLDALIGLQSLGIGNLFEKNSVFGNAGPAIGLPLFDGGARAARYKGAGADYELAVADYNRSVIAAYQQLADAVTARQLVARRLADTGAALKASEEAYAIARLRYEGGLSTYLDVLTVEDRLLQARLAHSELGAIARSVDVALIRALGGGYAPGQGDNSPEDARQ